MIQRWRGKVLESSCEIISREEELKEGFGRVEKLGCDEKESGVRQ